MASTHWTRRRNASTQAAIARERAEIQSARRELAIRTALKCESTHDPRFTRALATLDRTGAR